MRHRNSLIVAFGLIATAPVGAEVVDQSALGFSVRHEAEIVASPDSVWKTLRAPARWWSAEHSWSGDAANLWMDAQATGCFCEKLPPKAGKPMGSVQHARIVYADPGRLLRLSGALGPLQGEALTGTLTITLTPKAEATLVVFDYVVGGYMRFSPDAIATAVDGVIGQQLAGLKAATEAGETTP